MHLNTHICFGQTAIARRMIADGEERSRTAGSAEKATDRLVSRIKQRPDVRRAWLGCTTNVPGRPGECLIHLWINGGRRDVRVLPDGSMRWVHPVTFTEELWAETFGEVKPANDPDEWHAQVGRVRAAMAGV
jgi:hypothetical protein